MYGVRATPLKRTRPKIHLSTRAGIFRFRLTHQTRRLIGSCGPAFSVARPVVASARISWSRALPTAADAHASPPYGTCSSGLYVAEPLPFVSGRSCLYSGFGPLWTVSAYQLTSTESSSRFDSMELGQTRWIPKRNWL